MRWEGEKGGDRAIEANKSWGGKKKTGVVAPITRGETSLTPNLRESKEATGRKIWTFMRSYLGEERSWEFSLTRREKKR